MSFMNILHVSLYDKAKGANYALLVHNHCPSLTFLNQKEYVCEQTWEEEPSLGLTLLGSFFFKENYRKATALWLPLKNVLELSRTLRYLTMWEQKEASSEFKKSFYWVHLTSPSIFYSQLKYIPAVILLNKSPKPCSDTCAFNKLMD